MHADRARFLANHHRHAVNQTGIKRRAKRDGLRKDRAALAHHAMQGLAGLQVRDAEARHAIRLVGKKLQQFFPGGHLRQQAVRLGGGIGRDGGGQRAGKEQDGGQYSRESAD